ncbi:ras-like GTP-binding protein RhoL isoform X2 [Histomonas meleagridis]|uniref:ras-like GTP-binding protein RhoL isoform X2 n=1 Tax=Histomonas meleagridis TaxID=135588 RepID=UPI003559B9CF|nr:ras-like GTP-binding protein RhoL isoform X2 [Histomonas meleagridis]KAH0800867.1 ras-like GTP-binding protein RhoL isoform X2 [Histomonas meleagridis]
MSSGRDPIKLVAVGDGAVGKTCLLVIYSNGTFPLDYVPTVFENSKCKVKVNDQEYPVQLWDTAGQEELENIRTLSYPGTDIFLLCFSVVDRSSFENIKNKWVEEVKLNSKQPVILLVGTKTDLRSSTPPDQCVSYEEGVMMAKQIQAFDYAECSALKNEGVKEVFDKAIVKSISPNQGSGGCCNIS